jgi:hypothetical protein
MEEDFEDKKDSEDITDELSEKECNYKMLRVVIVPVAVIIGVAAIVSVALLLLCCE